MKNSSIGRLRMVLIAAIAIVIGVSVYAWLRPSPAAFLPAAWHSPGRYPSLIAATAAFPTFVHALAMPLLTVALLRLDRASGIAATCAAWCAVEIVFEVVQHRGIGRSLLARLPAAVADSGAGASFANFVRSGTFDPLDVAAAVLATATAYAIAMRATRHVSRSREITHV